MRSGCEVREVAKDQVARVAERVANEKTSLATAEGKAFSLLVWPVREGRAPEKGLVEREW